MSAISSVKIKGFWGDQKLRLKLDDGVNFLIGQNGSGKTTAINMIAAALTADIESLERLPFDKIHISLFDTDTKRRPSVEVSKVAPNELPFSHIEYSIKHAASEPAIQYPVGKYSDAHVRRSERHYAHSARRMAAREQRSDLREHLSNIAPVSSDFLTSADFG